MPNIGEFEDFFANVKLLMFRNWRVDNSKKKKEKAELVTFEYSPKFYCFVIRFNMPNLADF